MQPSSTFPSHTLLVHTTTPSDILSPKPTGDVDTPPASTQHQTASLITGKDQLTLSANMKALSPSTMSTTAFWAKLEKPPVLQNQPTSVTGPARQVQQAPALPITPAAKKAAPGILGSIMSAVTQFFRSIFSSRPQASVPAPGAPLPPVASKKAGDVRRSPQVNAAPSQASISDAEALNPGEKLRLMDQDDTLRTMLEASCKTQHNHEILEQWRATRRFLETGTQDFSCFESTVMTFGAYEKPAKNFSNTNIGNRLAKEIMDAHSPARYSPEVGKRLITEVQSELEKMLTCGPGAPGGKRHIPIGNVASALERQRAREPRLESQ